jgi:hypothetical protein
VTQRSRRSDHGAIGITTDEYSEYVALGTDLDASNNHQGALAAVRAALRIKPIAPHAPGCLLVVLNAQRHRDRRFKTDRRSTTVTGRA